MYRKIVIKKEIETTVWNDFSWCHVNLKNVFFMSIIPCKDSGVARKNKQFIRVKNNCQGGWKIIALGGWKIIAKEVENNCQGGWKIIAKEIEK